MFERVYTMTDYYDGPRGGIADFEGHPHAYASLFNEDIGNFDETFLLMPIDEELFRLALEDWAIWLRWEDAYHAGKTPLDTHPALSEERARHEELKRLIGDRLTPTAHASRKAKGEFRTTNANDGCSLDVRWTPLAE